MNRFITAAAALLVLSAAAARANDLTPDQQEEVKLKSGKWMAMRQKAEALEKKSKFEDAAAIFKEIMSQRQTLGLDLLSEYDAMGSLYMSWGKPDAALKTYQDMVAAREKLNGPDDPQVVYPLNQYAACLNKLGRKDEAKAMLARAASIQKNADAIPKFPKITGAAGSPARMAEGEKMRALGEKAMASELQHKAQAYFEQAVKLNSDDATAVCDRAEAESWNQQYVKAAADFDKAIKMKPDMHKAFVGRAYFHENQNQSGLAILDFEKAVALDPKDTESMGARAKLLQEMGQHKKAIDGYTKVIATDPKLYWPYVQRSVSYTALKQYKQAVDDLTTIVNRAPEDYEYREYRAGVYLKAGELKNALADYDKIIESNPTYSIGYHARAQLYEKLDGKKTPRALADYAMAKKFGY